MCPSAHLASTGHTQTTDCHHHVGCTSSALERFNDTHIISSTEHILYGTRAEFTMAHLQDQSRLIQGWCYRVACDDAWAADWHGDLTDIPNYRFHLLENIPNFSTSSQHKNQCSAVSIYRKHLWLHMAEGLIADMSAPGHESQQANNKIKSAIS